MIAIGGGSETLEHLDRLARRVHDLAGWHTEPYVDAADLPDLLPILTQLPQVSVDHLGLSRAGLPHVLHLVEHGALVKATGFSRGDLDVPAALRAVAAANPAALMLGTDLPCTRAPARSPTTTSTSSSARSAPTSPTPPSTATPSPCTDPLRIRGGRTTR